MILLIGGKGSIGRRYQAILKYLEEPFFIHDFPFDSEYEWQPFDRAIIATPTRTHGEYVRRLSEMEKPFLCEKPLTFDPLEAEHLAFSCKNGYVVNNYSFLNTNREFTFPHSLSYDFFNTGGDGLIWDVCQLVYLAYLSKAELSVSRESYHWDFHINDWKVPYSAIEASYMQMIRAFLLDRKEQLWTLSNGAQMTKLCYELYRRGGDCEAFSWDSGTDKFNATSREDLQKHRP